MAFNVLFVMDGLKHFWCFSSIFSHEHAVLVLTIAMLLLYEMYRIQEEVQFEGYKWWKTGWEVGGKFLNYFELVKAHANIMVFGSHWTFILLQFQALSMMLWAFCEPSCNDWKVSDCNLTSVPKGSYFWKWQIVHMV